MLNRWYAWVENFFPFSTWGYSKVSLYLIPPKTAGENFYLINNPTDNAWYPNCTVVMSHYLYWQKTHCNYFCRAIANVPTVSSKLRLISWQQRHIKSDSEYSPGVLFLLLYYCRYEKEKKWMQEIERKCDELFGEKKTLTLLEFNHVFEYQVCDACVYCYHVWK